MIIVSRTVVYGIQMLNLGLILELNISCLLGFCGIKSGLVVVVLLLLFDLRSTQFIPFISHIY